jgi:predicted Zn-dependent protease
MPARNGWVPAILSLALLMGEGEAALKPQAPTQRLRYRTRTATMGVRGLTEASLKDSAPAPAELELLEKWNPQKTRSASADLAGIRSGVLVSAPLPEPSPAALQGEIEAGRKLAAALLGAAPLVRDEATHEYLRAVGLALAEQSGRPQLPWTFGLLASDSVNAFAAPGGFVFLTLGLYRLLQSEAELATVLAHEVSHVASRHSYQLYLKQRAIEEAVKGTGKAPVPAPIRKALLKQLRAGAEFFGAALERESEFEADRLAVVFARDAGYRPEAFQKLLERLASQKETARSELSLLKATHPSFEERLRTLQAAWNERLSSAPVESKQSRDRFARYHLGSVRLVPIAPSPEGKTR